MTFHSTQTTSRSVRFRHETRLQWLQILVALAVLTMLWITRPEGTPTGAHTAQEAPQHSSLIAGPWSLGPAN